MHAVRSLCYVCKYKQFDQNMSQLQSNPANDGGELIWVGDEPPPEDDVASALTVALADVERTTNSGRLRHIG